MSLEVESERGEANEVLIFQDGPIDGWVRQCMLCFKSIEVPVDNRAWKWTPRTPPFSVTFAGPHFRGRSSGPNVQAPSFQPPKGAVDVPSNQIRVAQLRV